MYIVHKTLNSNDPRIPKNSSIIGHYWHFTIREILDGKGVYIDWLLYEKVSEEVAYSYKLSGSYKGIVSISEPVTNIKDMQSSSGDTEWKKYSYRLTKQDKANATELKKVCMRLFAREYVQNQKQLKRLLTEVNNCDTVERCDQVLHHYFGVNTNTTNGTPRNPEFKVDWPEEF